ncbi:hypothetical protein JCM5350_001358 [Sporobolomyces pararoseus]
MESSLRHRQHSQEKEHVLSNDQDTSPVSHLENTYPPFVAPNLTIKEVLGAIPPPCFERSALRSFLYVFRDFLLMFAVGFAASFIDQNLGSRGQLLDGNSGLVAKWLAWSVYWIVQGWIMTGIWVLGHECGHQAFSTSKTLNNLVGIFLHSFLLVPYHSWRISHARHHAATGHMDRDEVFVPRTLEERGGELKSKENKKKVQLEKGIELDELLEDAPLYRLVTLVGQQLLGWPLYLFMNVSGQTSYPVWTNHFDPKSIIFDTRHRIDVLLSDLCLISTIALFYKFAYLLPGGGGLAQFFKYYFIPYLFVNHWLVMITFLQHTDSQLPHYRSNEWTFVRGALCTIDRKFLGPVGTWLLHGIAETHVLHHISSKIPHYHAEQATQALKGYLGPSIYFETDENVFLSLWKSHRDCRYVDKEGDIVMYRDAYGRQRRKVELVHPASDSGVEGI